MIDNKESATLIPIITQNVYSDPFNRTRIYTDYLPSYNSLPNYNYNHIKVNHLLGLALNTIHINGIEGYWGQLKSTGVFKKGHSY